MMTTTNPFSALTQDGEAISDITCIEVRQAELNPLWEIVEQHSGIRFSVIDSANAIFGVHWKSFTFELIHQTETITIHLPATELVTTESAELMVGLLFALTFNNKAPAQIQTPNRAHEQILWTICTTQQRPIKAQKADQRSRFDLFASDLGRNTHSGAATLKHLERNQQLYIEKDALNPPEPPAVFSGLAKREQITRQLTMLVLNTDQRHPLFNLLIELGEISFELDQGIGNIVISLGTSKFNIEHKADLRSLSVLNTTVMKPGLAEVIARILEFLVLDPSQAHTAGTTGAPQREMPTVVHSHDDKVLRALWKSLSKQNRALRVKPATAAQEKLLRQINQEKAYEASRSFASLLQQNRGHDRDAGPSFQR